MTPEAQRIAIAEACGKVYHKPTEEEKKRGSYYQYEPDYLNDLNAMHEAEKVLTRSQLEHYFDNLTNCVFLSQSRGERKTTWTFMSTAAQRAEAFLRTLGKWKE
jgi:hypothetical protein